MGDLIYFIKTLVFTVIIVLLMQVKFGEETIETKTKRALTESSVGGYLGEVAEGGVAVVGKGYHAIMNMFNIEFDKRFSRDNYPGMRSVLPAMERSKSYVKDELSKKENQERLLEEYQKAESTLIEEVD